MKKYKAKANRIKKELRMLKKDGLPSFYHKMLRKGVDGKPNYTFIATKSKVLKLLHPEISRSREYQYLGSINGK